MKVKAIWFICLCAFSVALFAQSPQDCINAIPVCQNTIVQNTAYTGTGNIANEINPANSCLPNGEQNDVWYSFTVQTAGNLRFMIQPTDPNDDYNWALYNLTGKTCADIYNDATLEIACNASTDLTGRNMDIHPTGVGHTGAFTNHPYYGNFLYPAVTFDIPVLIGEEYVLNVSNFSGSNNGYTIDFGGSTAVLFNPSTPDFSYVTPPNCGDGQLTVNFNKPLLCNTVTASDFQLAGHTVTNVTSTNCNAPNGISDATFILDINPPLNTSGNLSLQLIGSVGDYCGNTNNSSSVNFNVNTANANAGADQIFCQGNSVNITLGDTTTYNNVTYSWGSNSTVGLLGLSSTNIRNPILNLINPTIDTIEFYQTITIGNCADTDTIQVSIVDCCANYDAQIVTVENVGCHGTNSGTALATATGSISGVNPQAFTYQWSNNQITTQATVLSANIPYTVVITDPLGCSDSATVTLTEPNAPISAVANGSTLACFGDNTGLVDLTVNGGTPPYTYQWSTGATTEDIYNLTAGFYFVTIVDANNCTITENGWVAQPPSALTVNGTGNVVACGATNGVVNLTVNGGGSPYNYQWSTGATTQNLSNLQAGTYTVTVTDLFGCKVEKSVDVTLSNGLSASATGSTIPCGATNSGTVSVTPTGGVAPYSYAWNSGHTTMNVNGLSPATYTVTVTDATGCEYVSSATVDVVSILTVTGVASAVSCQGNNDGSITLNVVSNQATQLTYQWSNNATTKDINNLSSGNYTVTVSDPTGCSVTKSYTITEPFALGISLNTSNISCNGAGDGTINAIVNGGTSPYSYQWSNGASNATINNLQAGNYDVTVTDARGCTQTATTTITEPNQLTAFGAPNVITCHGDATGTINLTVTGGSIPYTYQWSNGATTQNLTNLTAGIYTVTVTDANNCTRIALSNVIQYNAINANMVSSTLTCGNDNNGTITLNVTGGQFPYSFQWSNGATTQNLSNLTAGNYTVTITDANNCTKIATTTINAPIALSTSIQNSTTLCNGDASGSLNLTVSGGVTPYSFLWSNNATTQNLTGITAGNYTVTVTDANGCTKITTGTVTNQVPIVSVTATTPTSCNGGNDGTMTLNVTGGVSPYTFLWSNGSTAQNQTNLTGGVHFVTITDANNCSIVTSDIIGQPQGMTLTSNQHNVSCNSGFDGSLSITVTGGTAPYTYAWNVPVGNISNLSNLPAGTYQLTVTDAGGCSKTAVYTLTEPAPLTLTTIDIPSTCNQANGSIQATPSGGTQPYTYAWSANAGAVGNNATASNLVPGTYTVTVIDANNCFAPQTVNFVGSAYFNPQVTLSNTFCQPDSGSISISLDTMQYTYQWSSNTDITYNTNTVTNLTADNYFVTITNNNNACDTTMAFTIIQDSPLNVVEAIKSATCNQANGEIILNMINGTPPYNFNWSANANSTTSTATNLSEGTYSVTITDANCSIEKTISVTGTDDLDVTDFIVRPTCTAPGKITLEVNSGTSPYIFSWSGNANTGNTFEANNLSAGNYSVTINDVVGCSKSLNFNLQTVGEFDILLDTLVDNACYQGEAGIISISTNSLSYDLDYKWSNNETTPTISNLIADNYTVTVTDNTSGCTDVASFVISEPMSMQLDAGPDVNIAAGQTVQLTAVSNLDNLTYNWISDNGLLLTGQSIEVRPERTTTYTVSATLGNCPPVTDDLLVTISNKEDILVPEAFSPNGDGKNDIFNVFPSIGMELIEFNIYNRWGERMHADPTRGWDGKHRDIKMPAGAYIYLLVVEKDGKRESITGEVILVR